MSTSIGSKGRADGETAVVSGRDRRVAVLEWAATLGQVFAVAGQGLLLTLGTVGMIWGYATSGFYRLFFGLAALVLGLLAARISSVTFNVMDGVIRANTRRR